MRHLKSTIQYTAIGDSLTVGIGSFISPGFVGRYKKAIEHHWQRPVATHVHAKKGLTTGEILCMLDAPMVQQSIYDADLITITAGGNDLIDAAQIYLRTSDTQQLFTALHTAIYQLQMIIDKIRWLQNPHKYVSIKLINLYNPFPSIKHVDMWIRHFNGDMASLASSTGIKIADVYPLFAGHQQQLLSFDHIHPNAKGYAVITDALVYTGFPLINN